MEWMQHWQGLIGLTVTLGIAIGGIVFRAQVLSLVADKASAAAVERLAQELAANDRRLATLEVAISHLPTAEQMAALNLSIERLRGDVQTIGERVRAVEKGQDASAAKLADIDSYLRQRHG